MTKSYINSHTLTHASIHMRVCVGVRWKTKLNFLCGLMTHRAKIELPIMAAQLKPGPQPSPKHSLSLYPSLSLSHSQLRLSVRHGNGAIRKCECECEWETLLMMIDLGKHRNIHIQILLPAIRSVSSWLKYVCVYQYTDIIYSNCVNLSSGAAPLMFAS